MGASARSLSFSSATKHRLLKRAFAASAHELPQPDTRTLYGSCNDYKILDISHYLSEVARIANPKPLRLNETHRKCMLRTLTGIRDFDAQVKHLKEQLQWEKAIRFCRTSLLPLKDMRIRGAQSFQEGLDYCPLPYKQFRTPAKWFSFMAKGRQYQGRLEWLLVDIAPELIVDYVESMKEIDDKHVKLSYIRQVSGNMQYKDAAIKCMHLEFPRQFSAFDGSAVGKRSEIMLRSFLEQQNHSGIVLENVLVKPRAKRGSGVIAYEQLMQGMTTEFDSMIVEREGDDQMRILEVWEAKASISPVALYDVSVKKASSIKAILEDDSSRLIYEDERLLLNNNEMPLVGLFGSSLHPPSAAALRINSFACQRLLSQDVNAVLESLETGIVSVTKNEILQEIDTLRRALERVNPIIAVPRQATADMN